VLLALAPCTAAALTTHLSAVGLDLAAGVGVASVPLAPSAGGVVSAGWFRGQFDDQFSFGRYWWLGPTARVDVGAEGWRVAPLFEVRRGLDLLVAGVSYGVAGGPVLAPGAVGWTARAVGVAKLRRTRTFSFAVRLELGAEGFGDQVGPAGALSVGISLAKPLKVLTEPTAWTDYTAPTATALR
jgi:hypothetical protein